MHAQPPLEASHTQLEGRQAASPDGAQTSPRGQPVSSHESAGLGASHADEGAQCINGWQSSVHVQPPLASSQEQLEGRQPSSPEGTHDSPSGQPISRHDSAGAAAPHAESGTHATGCPQSAVHIHWPVASSQAHAEGRQPLESMGLQVSPLGQPVS